MSITLAMCGMCCYFTAMKKNQSKSKTVEAAKPSPTAAASPAESSPKAEQPNPPPAAPGVLASSSWPDSDPPLPEELLELAAEEVDRNLLIDYAAVIDTLREDKGFSFREIAEWLTKNGVPADYNSVYRLYTKGMDNDSKQRVEEVEAEEND